MNSRNRLNKVVFLMVLALLLVVTACSKDNGGSTNASSSPSPSDSPDAASPSASPSASPEATADADNDPLGKIDPPITARIAYQNYPFIQFAPGESVDDNEWTKHYADKLGINIKYDWTIAGDQYLTKFNVAMASNDLPDMFEIFAPQFQQLTQAGALEDLTPYLEQYGSEALKASLNVNDGISRKAVERDGKLYGLFAGSDVKKTVKFAYIRTDWMEKLGLQPPKTIGDVVNIAQAFAAKDPNGNGKQDEYGFSFDKNLGKHFLYLMNAYGSHPKIWVKDASGQLQYGSILPETKTALGKLADMYKNGILDKEFGVKDLAQVNNKDTAAGISGIIFTAADSASVDVVDSVKNDPKARWAPYILTGDGGETITHNGEVGVNTMFVVRKGYEHPEALIKMLNLYMATRTGTEDEFNLYSDRQLDDGKGGKTSIQAFFHSPFRIDSPFKNVDNYNAVNDAIKSGDTSKLNTEQKATLAIINNYEAAGSPDKDPDDWKFYGLIGKGGTYDLLMAGNYDMKNVQVNQYYGPATDGMAKNKATLDKLEEETFTRIVMGQAPLDEFDNFVKQWKSLGGDTITTEVNDWAKANQ